MEKLAARLRARIEAAAESGAFNGVIGVYAAGSPVLEMACGMRDFEAGLPMTVDSTFDLASITKQFTCSAIMLLEHRGLLKVSDPLEKYIPGIPYDVTLEMLMNHTGGLPDEDWCIQFLSDRSRPIDNETLIRLLREQPAQPLFAPGAGWVYSNIAYELLAPVVEIVSGRNFEEFLLNEFFKPAGMTRTRVHHRYMNLPEPHMATASYCVEDGALVRPENSSQREFVVPLEGVNGAGLVYTCVGDMNLWDRALRAGEILPKSVQQRMLQGVPTTREGENYGYGWFITQDGQWIHHSGGWPGYINQYYRHAERELCMVMLTNLQRDRDALDALKNDVVAILGAS